MTVVDPWRVKPVNEALVPLADRHRLVVTVQDSCRVGGAGAAIGQCLRDAGVTTPVRELGLPARFLGHGSRAQVLSECGLSGQDISRELVEHVARLGMEEPSSTAPIRAGQGREEK